MSTDIQQDHIDLLRFTTCGSVDDGKSTLIGRLLYDAKQLFDDQLEALERSSLITGDFNLANLTDGLRAEREQGITIDVAYRYFATPKRRFIVADTPGHTQYTRNMVTGASTANLAVILLDARKGVIEQTRRHAFIASLLGIPHLVVCVNKMDLVDYDEAVFKEIREDFEDLSTRLDIRDISFIPMSALKGDNVVENMDNMPWYDGPPVLSYLENVHIANDRNFSDSRLPVQYVIRPRDDEHHDFRGYAGEIASGAFRVGDKVVILPSNRRSTVKSLHILDEEMDSAATPQSVIMQLTDDIDISRGDTIVAEHSLPHVERDIEAMLCWMHDEPLRVGKRYLIKHGPNMARCILKKLEFGVDINTLDVDDSRETLELNDIGRVQIRCARPLVFDTYRQNRGTGAFILIDEATNLTMGAGMIREPMPQLPFQGDEAEYVI